MNFQVGDCPGLPQAQSLRPELAAISIISFKLLSPHEAGTENNQTHRINISETAVLS